MNIQQNPIILMTDLENNSNRKVLMTLFLSARLLPLPSGCYKQPGYWCTQASSSATNAPRSVRCLLSVFLYALTLLWCVPTQAGQCETAYERKAYQEVLNSCRQAAANGDLEAAFRLGEAYQYSNTELQDTERALHWYERAAERGHVLAQRNLATLYSNGEGVRQDHFKAYQWYKRAAAQGQPHSQLMLGMMYLYGEGAAADKEQALYWIQSAAENNEPYAQYMYGKIRFPEDSDAGIRWYRKAAEQNNEYALYRLGVLYYHGEYLPQDYEVALELAQRAIDAGHRNGSILKRKVLEMRPDLAQSSATQKLSSPPQATAAAAASVPDRASPPQPAPISSAPAKTGGAHWLLQQSPAHFSIQLAVMKELSSIERFHRWHGLEDQTHFYQSRFPAGDAYVLLYGSYANQQDAQSAIRHLPEKVKAMRPWVRSLGKLQQSYKAVSSKSAD